jgi:tRNA(fMet)-specific endonuclease VapC
LLSLSLAPNRWPEGASSRGVAESATLPAITLGELWCGAAKSAQRGAALEKLKELAAVLPVLPLPQSAAEAYGAMRANLERKGQMIGNNDLWIAAHARAADLTLVTNNEREFQRVRGLKIQNWAT